VLLSSRDFKRRLEREGWVLDRIRVPAVRDDLSAAISTKVEGEQRLEVAV
jgi:hypothetical protein